MLESLTDNFCGCFPKTDKMNIIVIGAPGAGKGTQSKMIANKYGLEHVTTGELLRTKAKENTDVGKKIKNLMSTGALFPDDIVKQVLDENMPKDNFVLDGYPRTLSQVDTLYNIDLVLFIDLPEEVCVERILHRNEGRSDDNEESIKIRLQAFKNETEPVIEYYQSKGLLKTIEGEGTKEDIFKRICDEISKKYNN